MTKKEVLERLCSLANDVARDLGIFPENPVDCFCGQKATNYGFQFDERVIEYIEGIVYDSGITRHE